MKKYHFNEGHTHEYVWWKLTDETYQMSTLRDISKEIGCRIYQTTYKHRLINFIRGSGYIVEESPTLNTQLEVIKFLSNHAYECNYFIPQSFYLSTKFFKIVTLDGDIELWVDGHNLAPIEDYNQYPCVDIEEAKDFLIEYQDLIESEYALSHTPDPLFEEDDDVRIVGAGDHYPMVVLGRIWLDHPFSKKHLAHWRVCAKRDGIIIRNDDCLDKTWVYLLNVSDEFIENRSFAIVSERNLRFLTPEDIHELNDIRSATLLQKRFSLNETVEPLFNLDDNVTWAVSYEDNRKAILMHEFYDIHGNQLMNFNRIRLGAAFFSEVNSKILDYFWLEHPSSRLFLDMMENNFRSNGFHSFRNFDRSRSKFWVYAIAFYCGGNPHVFFVPENQLIKDGTIYTNFLKSVEKPDSYILIEKATQLSLKISYFWDLVFPYEINPQKFSVVTALIFPVREDKDENE